MDSRSEVLWSASQHCVESTDYIAMREKHCTMCCEPVVQDPCLSNGQSETVIPRQPSEMCKSSSLYQCSLEESVELKCPVLTPLSIHLEFSDDVQNDQLEGRVWQCGHNLPFAASEVFDARLTSAKRLTDSDAVKETWELDFIISHRRSTPSSASGELGTSNITYVPGDAFGFLCPNSEKEVDKVLSLTECGSKRKDTLCTLRFLKPDKAAKQFAHLPRRPTTLAHIIRTCCDIRGILKKSVLRALAEYAQDKHEKRRLLELSSSQGAADYAKCVLEQRLTILDLLTVFRSCRPPVELLLEHLPRLQPRFYSAASWRKQMAEMDCTTFKIIYKRVILPASPSSTEEREGLCTGWLTRMATDWTKEDIAERVGGLSLDVDSGRKYVVTAYLRKNVSFRFPDELSAKVVMVGPGAGLAPFLCYLQWREEQMNQKLLSKSDAELGEAWLFCGCRYLDLDFLYKDALEGFLERRVLSRLSVASSRGLSTDKNAALQRKYVQDCIRESWADVSRMIVQEEAYVYVCGDAHNMATDVQNAFSHVLQRSGLMETEEDAKLYVKAMQEEGRYLQDVWA